MKKALSFILSLALVISMSSAASVISYAASDDVNMSVTLDGDWHYKVYRTYDQMYQYLPYDMVNVVWEDIRPIPSGESWFENVWASYRRGEIVK